MCVLPQIYQGTKANSPAGEFGTAATDMAQAGEGWQSFTSGVQVFLWVTDSCVQTSNCSLLLDVHSLRLLIFRDLLSGLPQPSPVLDLINTLGF